MSDLSGTLGLTSAQPVGCGRGLTEEQECVEVSGGLEGPELWTKDLGVQERNLEPHSDGPAPVTYAPPSLPPLLPLPPSAPIPIPVPSTLANGVRMSRRPVQGTRRRSQLLEAVAPRETRETPAETPRSMQAHVEPGALAILPSPQNNSGFCTNAVAESHTGSEGPEQVRTSPAAEIPRTASPQPQPPPPLSLINHPVGVADQPASFDLAAAREFPSTLSPVPLGPSLLPDPASSSLPVEAERKYALRSSGRPRFPCHLRKSSRIRRSAEDGDRRGRKEKDPEEGGTEESPEDKLFRVKEEAVTVGEVKELPSVDGIVPAVPCPTKLPLALTVVSKPVPKATPKSGPKPGPKLGPKPGPRPSPKSARRPGPKSVQRTSPISASSNRPSPHPAFPRTPSISGPQPTTVKKEEPVELEVTPTTKRRRGRFVGVRRIVVKVARIPVNLSRRQKSYKISNLETVSGPEKSSEGVLEGLDPVREPTALLRMKNNGKSVMVMFPPGELPVILKRRRGRPPKQAPPGIPGEPVGVAVVGGNPDQPKKPRRRRRTKLPCPFPSYVNDTNDVKTEYGDVLSKLAFLNRQPPTTGRCSPPRCWTPSEPESFHVPSENPGISTLLHRLTGFRRRGGRGGGVGRGGGAAGGMGGGDFNKSTFSDFFESIGKKRKLNPLSETGLPRKRGKGANAGGVGRGGGIVGSELGGEKPVRKRRSRKNGALKGEAGSVGQDWGNGAGPWGEEGSMEREKGGAYQACGSPRGGFSSCEAGRGGTFSGAAGGRGAGPGAEGPQGLFAGYFRSLLDSDDSSDLLDGSSQRESRKAASTPGYEPSSPVPGPSWSPAFPKRSPKAIGAAGEGAAQTQPSSARTPYSYNNLAQTSPTPSCYPKSAPPSLSLSHSPSSPHPSSYGSYSSGFSAASPSGGGGASQRSLDCSFSLGPGQNSGKAAALSAAQMGYSGYQLAAKRGFSGYPGAGQSSAARGELGGPTSPGGGYMSVAKCSPFSSSISPEGYRHYNSSQWSYRQGYGGWAADSFGSQYHNYSEYGSNESKDILDISNYTPQKAKRQPFPESLSESSSDSSHLSSAATGSGPSSGGGSFKQKDSAPVCAESGQSSLSSLEKLMMDWHESAAGPSYNWSQNVLFQSAGSSKQGRGRRKRAEPQQEKERAAALPPDSPSIPSPTPVPKRGGVGGRPRGSRGGRGGLSPCQRERPSGAKGRAKSASALSLGGATGVPECSELFQEGPDYYSGDSCSLSPLATPNPAAPAPYLQDPSEYPSPYSAHPSTPSSEERYPAIYPGESSSSLSPSISSPPYPPKPTPPPAQQTFHPGPSRTFSPSCSPAPRVTPHGGTALSPPHRAPPKDPQYPQYDSPSYCSSPFWYGQSSHSGSLSPQTHPGGHSGAAPHAHPNPHPNPHPNSHMSPHGHAQGNPLAGPHANALAQLNPGAHPHNAHHHNTHPNSNLSPHAGAPQQLNPGAHLHPNPHAHPAPHGGGGGNNNNSQPQTHPHHSNPHLHPHHTPHSSPGLHPHPTSMGFEDRHPPSPMAHKRELSGQQQQQMSSGHHQGPLPHSPYHKPPLDSSPHQEDMVGGYALPHHPYQGGGQRYAAQAGRGGGVLCQLLEPASSDDGFSVTSL